MMLIIISKGGGKPKMKGSSFCGKVVGVKVQNYLRNLVLTKNDALMGEYDW